MVESQETASRSEGLPVSPGEFTTSTPDFDGLYRDHAQSIYYLALRLLGDPLQAEDATQDVFLKAYAKFSTFRGESEVRTWLYRITLNHCSHLRLRWSVRNIQTTLDESDFDQLPGPAEDPLRHVETKELGERIQRTLLTLPEDYRVLLLLVADQNLSYEQIGTLTQQTADAVRGKLHRARRAFTQAFAKTA